MHRFCWILKFTEFIYTPTKLTQKFTEFIYTPTKLTQKFTEFIYTPTKLTQNPRWLALLPDQDTEWDINATILCAYV